MKYTWEAEEHAEYWRNGTCGTIEECIEKAKKEGHKVIYVGEAREYSEDLEVNAEDVLYSLEEYASSNYGEFAEEWCPSDQTKEAIAELTESLTLCLRSWLEKHGEVPQFFVVENIKKIFINQKKGHEVWTIID